MPANIARRKDGRAAFVLTVDGRNGADKPAWWDGQGQYTVPHGMTRRQALHKSGCDFEVVKVTAGARIGRHWVEATDQVALVRKDTHAVLAYVTPDYRVFQNTDGVDLAYAVVGEAGSRRAAIVSMGALGNGSRVFMTLDLTRFVKLHLKREPSATETFVFLDWAHDGDGAIHAGPWNRIVVCNNTLDMGTSYAQGKGRYVSITHMGDMAAKVREAQQTLGFIAQAAKAYEREMNRLADIPLPTPVDKWLAEFGERLIPIPEDMERPVAREAAREMIATLYRKGKGAHERPESPYRVLQAVAEYADHYRPLRVADPRLVAERTVRTQMASGAASDLKARALELLRQEFELTPAKVLVPAGRASAN